MVIFAITFTIASPILIEIGQTLSEDVSKMGLLFTFFFIGFVSGSILSGILQKVFSKFTILLVNFFSQSVFILLFSFSKNFTFAMSMYFAIGMCGALSETLVSNLLTEINVGKEGYYLNISQMFFGIGAFIGPYISSMMMIIGGNWNSVFYISSFLAFLNFMIFAYLRYKKVDIPIRSKEKKDNAENEIIVNNQKRWSLMSISALILASLAMFMYTASEDGLNAWLPTFFRVERGFSHLESGQILSFFWLTIAIGRLVSAFLAKKINLAKLTIILSVAGLIFVLMGLFVSNKFINFASFLIAGFFYSGVWPNIIAFTSKYLYKNKDVSISTIITFGGIGALFAPWLVGIVYIKVNLLAGLLICAVFLFIEILLLLLLYSLIEKSKAIKSNKI